MKNSSRDKLITEHLEMAAAIAAQCISQYNLSPLLQYSDVLAYAHQGLVEAAQRYSPNSNTQFRSFAWSRIRGAVIDGVRKSSRLGFSRTVGSASAAPAVWLGSPPVNAGLHDQLSSLDPRHDDPVAGLPDEQSLHYSPEADVDERRLRAALLRAIDALPALERDVTLRHYYHGEDIAEIGKRDGRSKYSVSRTHARCLRQLRATISDTLPAHLATEVTQ
jgi:RNA polymerase sigma factor for flagellar operon FliA